ncbi:MAG: hypothetical protein AAF530_23470, partial [Pseudomonadota bacterium]
MFRLLSVSIIFGPPDVPAFSAAGWRFSTQFSLLEAVITRRNQQSYKDAGVDIDAGNALVEAIKPLAKSTA